MGITVFDHCSAYFRAIFLYFQKKNIHIIYNVKKHFDVQNRTFDYIEQITYIPLKARGSEPIQKSETIP